jgi:putative methionine-R-sulfoxide reductase with GAF domain
VSLPERFADAPLSSPLERRKHARKKVFAAVATVLDAAAGCIATVVDLSEGGVGIRSDSPLQHGAFCRLQLRVPNSTQVIEAACEVAWNRAPHAGFRFSILTEKSQQQIKAWLTGVQDAGDSAEHMVSAIRAGTNKDAGALAEQKIAQPEPGQYLLAALSDDILVELAMRARQLTEADGVAVAISDGREVVCRASLGAAPDVGARIQPDRGLSGECLRTGEIVACYDVASDARVNRSIAHTLSMRSAMILPLGRHETPIGLLEVFFSRAHAFEEDDIYALQELAATFLLGSQTRSEVVEAAATPVPTTPPPTGLPKMASFSSREPSPGHVLCDVCGHENSDDNRVCEACDVPLPSALRYVDLNSPVEFENSGLREQRTQVEFPDPPARSTHRKKLLVMLLATTLVLAWQARGRISSDARLPAPPLPKLAPVPILQPSGNMPEKGPELPLKAAEWPALKVPAEPEVTIRNFGRAKPTAKIAPSSPAKRNISKTLPAPSTMPADTRNAKQGTTPALEPASTGGQPVMLPLNDQEVASAVASTTPVPPKPKEARFWKRWGTKFFGGKAKPAPPSEHQ